MVGRGGAGQQQGTARPRMIDLDWSIKAVTRSRLSRVQSPSMLVENFFEDSKAKVGNWRSSTFASPILRRYES